MLQMLCTHAARYPTIGYVLCACFVYRCGFVCVLVLVLFSMESICLASFLCLLPNKPNHPIYAVLVFQVDFDDRMCPKVMCGTVWG